MRGRSKWLLRLVCLGVVSCPLPGYAQNQNLAVAVLVDSTNTTGYNTSSTTPGEYQRFTERYLEHLQIPYELFDVSSAAPPLDINNRQLIIAAHRGLNLPASWMNGIVAAVNGGAGFVNLDADPNIGNEFHMRTIFGASGSLPGTPATQIVVPATFLASGATPHYITALQTNFFGPAGDITYAFHPDVNGVVNPATSTNLTGANGIAVTRLGNDPLIVVTYYGAGRAVHFGTLDYLRADRLGFLLGVDDLFWRSLAWAARKPFALRGYPRFWSMVLHHNSTGWASRIQEMYDPTLTGQVAADGTGGPWKVTGSVFTSSLPAGSADRTSMISDIQAGRLQVHPHGFNNVSFGDAYWNSSAQRNLTDSEWLANLNSLLNWQQGNGGADRIPSFSRWMVGHFFNLSNNLGYDLWNSLGFRYIATTLRPGFQYNYIPTQYNGAERLNVRPFWILSASSKGSVQFDL